MRQLHFDLLRLLEDDRQGSDGTRRGRRYVLAQAAETLHRLGPSGACGRGDSRDGTSTHWWRSGGGRAVGRHDPEPHGAHPLPGAEDRQAGHRVQGQRELWVGTCGT